MEEESGLAVFDSEQYLLFIEPGEVLHFGRELFNALYTIHSVTSLLLVLVTVLIRSLLTDIIAAGDVKPCDSIHARSPVVAQGHGVGQIHHEGGLSDGHGDIS